MHRSVCHALQVSYHYGDQMGAFPPKHYTHVMHFAGQYFGNLTDLMTTETYHFFRTHS